MKTISHVLSSYIKYEEDETSLEEESELFEQWKLYFFETEIGIWLSDFDIKYVEDTVNYPNHKEIAMIAKIPEDIYTLFLLKFSTSDSMLDGYSD